MVRQILFLTSTALLMLPILLSSGATAQSPRMKSVKAQPRPLPLSKKVESGSSILGVHEVNVQSVRTKPQSSTASKRMVIKKAPEVKLAPVHRGVGIVSPADENEGLQVQVTGID
jgi:hypothetical protein